MTRTTNTFGALAFATLTVFALWTSTLAAPVPASLPAPIAPAAASVGA